MGDAKGCVFEDGLARAETPATDSIFCKRDGGITMSRSAFGYVVDGCPPESNVSSNSFNFPQVSHSLVRGKRG